MAGDEQRLDSVAEPDSLRVEAEIHGDLEFSVADDRAGPLDAEGSGYDSSLLGPNRFFAAAAALHLHAETCAPGTAPVLRDLR